MAQITVQSPPPQEQRLKMSYEEFLEWADDVHAEWVNGEVIVFMPPKTIHQQIVGFLYYLIVSYVRYFKLGEVITAPFEMRLLPNHSSREPDLLFVARENVDRLTPERLEGPADLVVELVSDSSVGRDRADKFYEYQEAGVREYWIIDPRPGKERADFYVLGEQGKYQAVLTDANGKYHSTVLPGFWMNTEWMWQNPLPDPLALLISVVPNILQQTSTTDATRGSE